jgi:methylmalonyl-CoA/ethylmalonyl-CoA epimerase
MAARIKHIALATPDADRSARFYETVLGMKRVGLTHSGIAGGCYLSDGDINLALLTYRSEKAAGPLGMGYAGIHHFGWQVDDLDAMRARIEANGGKFFLDLPVDRATLNYEMKFTDPDGQIFDISKSGWIGTQDGWSASPAVPKIKHIALSVQDPDRTAKFYEAVFGMKRIGPNGSAAAARGFYLTDGHMNLAVLHFLSDKVAGRMGKDFVGIHHFGYVVSDLDGRAKTIADNGGRLFHDMPERRQALNYEMKFLDLDGQIFDISHNGWAGTAEGAAHAKAREAATA